MSQFCARSVIQEVVSGVVRPDGFARNVAWTPNYNGVNSYVRIPDWKPVGEFEIEFDAHADLNNQPAAGGAWKRVLSAVPGNTSCIYTANNHWHSAYLTGVLRVDSKGDFHKLRYEGTETIQPLLFIGGHNQGDIIKGQISNLKLILLIPPA